MTFWESFFLVLEMFFFLAYLVVLFHIIGDVFRDHEIGGFAKAMWVLFLILLPVLTALAYLIFRGRGMNERQAAAVRASKESADSYIRTVAGSSPAQQISTAKELLDTGAITPQEFEQLKARALTPV